MHVLMIGLLVSAACRTDDKQDETSGEDSSWWEELDDEGEADEEGDTDKPEDTDKPDGFDDTGKPSGGDKDECGDEVGAGEPCEGDWTTTLCTNSDGELWWCEDGTWTNEK